MIKKLSFFLIVIICLSCAKDESIDVETTEVTPIEIEQTSFLNENVNATIYDQENILSLDFTNDDIRLEVVCQFEELEVSNILEAKIADNNGAELNICDDNSDCNTLEIITVDYEDDLNTISLFLSGQLFFNNQTVYLRQEVETSFFPKDSIDKRIEGTIWFDNNDNNLLDSTENGINGVRMNLYRYTSELGTNKELVDTQFTGQKPNTPSDDGYYTFEIEPGFYYSLEANVSSSLIAVSPNFNDNVLVDSQFNQSTNETDIFYAFQSSTDLIINGGFKLN